MRQTLWISLLVVFWAVLVVRAVPAQWGIWVASPPVQFDGVSGTVWSGKAANVVIPTPNGSFALGELQWSLNPWTLLTLNPCADFSTKLSAQTIAGNACSSVGGTLTLRDVEVNVPAAAAEVWMPVSIQGEFFLQLERLKLADNKIETLVGKGSWNGARYHNSEAWMNIGSMAFDLSPDGKGGLLAKVFDLEGPMGLDITSQFSLDGAYDIRGDIVLRQNAPQEIAQFLMIIAKEVEQGRYRFEWVGG